MRIIFTILLLKIYVVKATVYYVSNSGSDANNGTSTGTSWQTIAKVNSFSFAAGDIVSLKDGDTWNERLKPLTSGTSGNPITFTSYGTGAKPLITGFQTVTMASAGGNLWTATVNTSVNGLNTVMVNGVLQAKGRYPNTTYISTTGSTTTQLNGTGLTGTPNYTGAEVVVTSRHWVLDKSIVTSQSGATLNISPALSYTPLSGYGFFFQNLPSFLDTDGEWSFNSTTKLLTVYSTTTPTVQVSFIDTLAWVSKKNYITIDGLAFTGANTTALQVDSSSYFTRQNCSINNTGSNGVTVNFSPYLSVINDSIRNSLNNGTFITNCNNSTVRNCYVDSSGIYAGMGESGEAKYCGIYFGGLDTLSTVRDNQVFHSGYQGIMFFSYNGLVYQNYVRYFTSVKDDGAGIYAGWNYTKVRKNIIGDALFPVSGRTPDNYLNPCIYIDNGQDYFTIDSNTVFNSRWSGINISTNSHYAIKDNVVYNTIGNGIGTDQPATYESIQRNVIYIGSSSYYTYSRSNAPSVTDTIDYNYYLRPSLEQGKLSVNGSNYGFAQWQSTTGYDAHGGETPTGITADAPLFYYNPTSSDSTISLGTDSYYSAKGEPYRDKLTLKPFTSIILFKSQNDFLKITGQLKTKLNSPFKSL